MSDRAAELIVDVGGRKTNLEKVLRATDSDLKKSADLAARAAATIGNEVAGAEKKAAQEALLYARALSQLQAKAGDTQGAMRTLASAIASVDQSTAGAIGARNQLISLEQRHTRELVAAEGGFKGFASVVQNATSVLGGFGLALGAQQIVQFGLDAGKASLDLQRTQNVTKALTGDTATYNSVLQAARQQQILFGGSLQENLDGLAGLTITAKQSGAELKQLIDLSGRLGVLDPSQGTAGARIALSEALSGDITSLAKRYEIPKAALKAIKDESLSGAERLKVLDDYLNKVGITSEVVGGSISTQAQAFNRLAAELDNVKVKLGSGFANAFAPIADSLATSLGASEAFSRQAQQLVASGQSYEQYSASVTRSNGALNIFLGSLGQFGPLVAGLFPQVQQLSEAQFTYAQGLIQQGTATDEAIARATTLGPLLQQLGQIQEYNAVAGELSAGAMQGLSNEILNLAASSPTAQANVLAMVEAFLNGQIGAEELRAAIERLKQGLENKAQASALVASEDAVMIGQMQDSAKAAQEAADASLLDAQAKELEAAQAALLQEKTKLAGDAILAANPHINAAGVASLKAAGDISAATAEYINNALAIAKAKAELAALQAQAGIKVAQAAFSKYSTGRAANDDIIQTRGQVQAANQEKATKRYEGYVQAQRDGILVTGTAAQKQDEYNRRVQEATKAYGANSKQAEQARIALRQFEQQQEKAAESAAKKGRGGGGVSAAERADLKRVNAAATTEGQLTEAQIKGQDKREDALEKHLEKVQDIEADFYEKRADAKRKFEQALLETDADIYGALIDLENQDIARQYDAQYQQFLQGLPAIAAEKGEDVAEAYAEAYQQVLERRARAQQDIEKAKADGNTDRATALEGVETKRRAAEDRRLQEILEGRNSLRNQEQKALGDEAEAWEGTQAKIDESTERTTDKIERASDRRTAALARESAAANNTAAAYDKIGSGSKGGNSSSGSAATNTTPASRPATNELSADGDANLQALAQINNSLTTISERVAAVEEAVKQGSDQVARAAQTQAQQRALQ